MSSQEDIQRLIQQATGLQHQRANCEVDLQRLVALEHSLNGHLAKLNQKVQTLEEQLQATKKALMVADTENETHDKEVGLQQEVTQRMAASVQVISRELATLKEYSTRQKGDYARDYATWKEQLELKSIHDPN